MQSNHGIAFASAHRAAGDPQILTWLKAAGAGAEVMNNVGCVDNGRVICAAGLIGGVELALHVVQRLLGAEIANATAVTLEYDWSKSSQDKPLVSQYVRED